MVIAADRPATQFADSTTGNDLLLDALALDLPDSPGAVHLRAQDVTDYIRPFHDGRHSSITNDAAAGNSGLAVMKRAGHSDFRVTQQYLDLAGVDFAEEAERAAARAFAHVPRAKVRAQVQAE